eukprot:TRINITY_DN8344_c0_g1_i1.p1 TRINITY_DN8344_c0_g1~~TRINITY_DN8344_c0_g1_i1.p1  ORF type:complete len:328 (+),score=95.33 TRINITY_DN8344_c0_g1_i1:40-984(+)
MLMGFGTQLVALTLYLFFFFLMIRRPPRSTQGVSSAASDVYKRQYQRRVHGEKKYTQNYDNLNEQLLQERKTHSESLAELEKSYKELEEKYRTVSDNYQEALQEWNTKENIYKSQIDTLQEKITNFHADSDKRNTKNYQTTVVVEKDITQEKEYLDLEKEKNDQIDILKNTLNEYSQQISDLQFVKEQNDELSNQMELLDEEKKNAVFIKSKLEKEKANLERKVATLEEQIKTLENEIQFLKNNNDKLNELLDNEKSIIELKNTEINTYIQQLKEKSLENENFQDKLIIKAEQDEIIMESAKKITSSSGRRRQC